MNGFPWVPLQGPPFMDAAPAPGPPATASPPRASGVPAWPRPAQLATALLLVLAVALLGVRGLGATRWAARPTDLQPGAGLAYRVDLNRADRTELRQL